MISTISTANFIHPEDAAAKRQLEAIPGFAQVLKLFLRAGIEQYLHGTNMASKIRLSDQQLPDLYQRIKRPCALLGIPEPEFYLEMDPTPNAYTFGDTRVFLVVTSGLIEYLEEDEVDAVLAHECGHIVCRHVLYHTMAKLLVAGAEAIGILGGLSLPIRLALFYWSRRSELSADRAAAAVMGSAQPVVETMIRLSGGPRSLTKAVNIEAYAAQAEAYDFLKQESQWDKMLQLAASATLSHPFPAVRTREILAWCATDPFRHICRELHETPAADARCPGCQATTDASWKFCRSCGQKL